MQMNQGCESSYNHQNHQKTLSEKTNSMVADQSLRVKSNREVPPKYKDLQLEVEIILPPGGNYTEQQKEDLRNKVEVLKDKVLIPEMQDALSFMNQHTNSKSHKENLISMWSQFQIEVHGTDHRVNHNTATENAEKSILEQVETLKKPIKIVLYFQQGSNTVGFVHGKDSDKEELTIYMDIGKSMNASRGAFFVHELDHKIWKKFYSETTKKILSGGYIKSKCNLSEGHYNGDSSEINARMMEFKFFLWRLGKSPKSVTEFGEHIDGLLFKEKLENEEEHYFLHLLADEVYRFYPDWYNIKIEGVSGEINQLLYIRHKYPKSYQDALRKVFTKMNTL